MATKDQIDQDALAAEWGLALESDSGAAPANSEAATATDEAAAQWAAMVDDGSGPQSAKGGAERVLNQEEPAGLPQGVLSALAMGRDDGLMGDFLAVKEAISGLQLGGPGEDRGHRPLSTAGAGGPDLHQPSSPGGIVQRGPPN